MTTKTSSPSTITTETTTRALNPVCSEWLGFGAIKNITTNDNKINYTFCFYVDTISADVTISANTWTSCDAWKRSGAADPMMVLHNITNGPVILAQNDDGNHVDEFNCYAALLSYRLNRGRYHTIIKHPKCNYGNFELRLSDETLDPFK